MIKDAHASAHEAVFKDSNPNCPLDEKYKIVTIGDYESHPKGLYWLGSPDGIHFSPIGREPFMTKGLFDSQNLAFWDSVAGVYREYHRASRRVVPDSHRAEMMKGQPSPRFIQHPDWVMTSTSKDLCSFSKPELLEFPGAPIDELYTNQIQSYYRAPHILMGFPMRYVNRG